MAKFGVTKKGFLENFPKPLDKYWGDLLSWSQHWKRGLEWSLFLDWIEAIGGAGRKK
jgi:hypothetical protein